MLLCSGRLLGIAALFALLSSSLAAERVPNTTLKLPSSPPQSGFATAPAFGSVTFTDPVAVAAPPGETNRLFVAEQAGIVAIITNLAAPTRTVFLNIASQVTGGVPTDEQGLLGLAFHPNYASNGYIYLYYSSSSVRTTNLNGSVNTGLHQCLSRFTVSGSNADAADPASELRLLVMPDQAANHNGGCLQFGPDGYLYVSTGDEGGGNDQFNNSQRITNDFWSGILRIDVDSMSGNLVPTLNAAHRFTDWNGQINYRIPTNNPFVGATQFKGSPINTNLLRAEFWAVGLRNPWRFSFDPLDGALYCGDVGENTWEEINVIVAGGNYGWAYREGNDPGPKSAQAPPGFASVAPIIAYGHGSGSNQGYAVVGGVVYRSDRLPSLYGKYVFADYSGNIWAAQPNGSSAVPFSRLTSDPGVSAFGTDPRNGDVLLCHQTDDTIKRLVAVTNLTGPLLLSATGAFTNLTTLTPNAGILPYEINLPFWSDNALKSRWFSVPNTNLTLTFGAEGNWSFPTGSVWIKHFDLETNTLTHALRRMETRLLVRYTNGVYGLSYRWMTPPTNALLVGEEGMDELVSIDENGLPRQQLWRYPGRGECLRCHTSSGGWVLGMDTLQMNRAVTDGSTNVNQIQRLSDLRYFGAPVTGLNSLRALAHPSDEAASLEWRARSYLQANCSFCHRPGGTVGSWDGRFATPTRFANLINGIPFNPLGNPSNRIIVPGATNFSLIHSRISTRGAGAMPPLASTLVDTNGVALLSRWITSDLTNYQTYSEWQESKFGAGAPGSGEFEDFDGDQALNYLEYLTGTDPIAPVSGWGLGVARNGDAADIVWTQPANRVVELQWTTSLAPANWLTVDHALNQPYYPSSNRVQQFSIPAGSATPIFFRARVVEP